MESIYSQAQWKWAADKYREGYTVLQLAAFLCCHRQTVTNHLRQMLAMPRNVNLPDLAECAEEFRRLDQGVDNP